MNNNEFFKKYPSLETFIRETKKLKRFYKKNQNDIIWWVDNVGRVGIWEFSFDKKKIYNMFRDYPWKLSKEEKKIFDRENPYWANFFKDRK